MQAARPCRQASQCAGTAARPALPPGVLLGLVQALLDLQVGLSVQVHGLDVADALLVLCCEQQQVGGEELVLVHRHDVARLDVGPCARLKLLRLRVEHVHLWACAAVRRAPCVCRGCGGWGWTVEGERGRLRSCSFACTWRAGMLAEWLWMVAVVTWLLAVLVLCCI